MSNVQVLDNKDFLAILEKMGYGNTTLNDGGRVGKDEIRQQIQEVIEGPLAAFAAGELAAFVVKLKKLKYATPDDKRYADVLFGILDRAGFAPHRAKDDGAPPLEDMKANELAALRSQINGVLAARAKPIAQDDAPKEATRNGIPLSAFD